ncbi:MAG: EAL domain-containing protein [Pseudomonadota bacterium]
MSETEIGASDALDALGRSALQLLQVLADDLKADGHFTLLCSGMDTPRATLTALGGLARQSAASVLAAARHGPDGFFIHPVGDAGSRSHATLAAVSITGNGGCRTMCALVWQGAPAIDKAQVKKSLTPLATLLRGSLDLIKDQPLQHTLEQALDAVPHLIWVMGKDRRYLFQNKADRNSFRDMRGQRLMDLGWPEEIVDEWSQLHGRALGGEEIVFLGQKTVDGKEIIAENFISPIRSDDGQVSAIVGFSIDRTSEQQAEAGRKQAMEALRESETLLTEIAELSGVGGWELDLTRQQLRWTAETKRIHKVPADYVPNVETAIDFYVAASQARLGERMDAALEAGESWDEDFEIKDALGQVKTVRVVGRPVVEDGRVVRLQGAIQDVTEAREAERQLKQAYEEAHKTKALLEDVVEAIPDGIVAFDAHERLVLHNKAFLRFFDRVAADGLVGKSFEQILKDGVGGGQFAHIGHDGQPDPAWVAKRLAAFREPGEAFLLELHDGRWLQVRDQQSASGNTVGIRSDITEIKRNEEKLKYVAEHDLLTGISSRAVLQEALDRATRKSAGAALHDEALLVIIDLDNFKDINDTLGHDVGDEALRQIATRLKQAAYDAQVVSRLGGDEFGLLLTNQPRLADYKLFLDRLSAQLTQPIVAGTHELHPTFSIGASVFPRDARNSTQLFKAADIALYEAKRTGRDRWCLFESKLSEELERRLFIADRLTNPHPEDRFEVVLQPKVQADTRAHFGFEALLRWSVDSVPISSSEFIPIAEDCGAIVEIGELVLDRVLSLHSATTAEGVSPGPIAINVAAVQLFDPGFSRRVFELLTHYGVPPNQLEIEITERVLLDRQTNQVTETLRDLRTQGIKIALDDFGTGYASLSHLHQFPIDVLKIDRAFISKMLFDRGARSIVSSMVSLGKELGLVVVGEGVEHPDQADMLRDMGCDLLQGFLTGVPMSADVAVGRLARPVIVGGRALNR